ncbi:MAG: hypothetical protein V4850_11050 [Myxococcota bacterium]
MAGRTHDNLESNTDTNGPDAAHTGAGPATLGEDWGASTCIECVTRTVT